MMGNNDAASETRPAILSEVHLEQTKQARGAEPPSAGDRGHCPVQGADKMEPTTPTRQQKPRQQRVRQERMLDRSIQARIGAILRDSFADIEGEPLPKRLQDLIKALQANEEPL